MRTPQDVAAKIIENFIATVGDTLVQTIRKVGAPNPETLEVASRGADLAKLELQRAVERIRSGDAERVFFMGPVPEGEPS